MAKTQEELNTLKVEYETLNNKLKELSEDELKDVIGGTHFDSPVGCDMPVYPDDSCPECERCEDCKWVRKGKISLFCTRPNKG